MKSDNTGTVTAGAMPQRGECTYLILVGDRNACIYWAGEYWTYNRQEALKFDDWKEAKLMMAELRDSWGSTIRTQDIRDCEREEMHRERREAIEVLRRHRDKLNADAHRYFTEELRQDLEI